MHVCRLQSVDKIVKQGVSKKAEKPELWYKWGHQSLCF